MKRSVQSYIIGILALFGLLVVPLAFAETNVDISNNDEGAHSSVDVHTNTGNNTICQNGKCTTSNGSNGKSTVCINGKCETSEDGSVHMESNDGHSKVDINNKTGNSSVNVNQNSTTNVSDDGEAQDDISGTPSPTDKVKEKKEEVKKVNDAFTEFFKSELEFLKKLFTFHF